MPKLVENSSDAQPSHLPVVGEAPRERCEIPVVATEPVATESPPPVREGVGYLQVAEPHDKVATGVFGDVQDQQQPRPLRAPRGERRVRRGEPHDRGDVVYTRLQNFLPSPFSFAEERDFHFASVRSVEAGRTARAERQVRSGRTEARPTAMGRGFVGVERSSVMLNLWETAC